MCINFTNLNKACPKDRYPLSTIDKVVDSKGDHVVCSLVDATFGYPWIKIDLEDEDKTTFIMDSGVYCYNVMPFGLKNTGATYQRLIDKMFKDLIGKNIEIYINDMIIKSRD